LDIPENITQRIIYNTIADYGAFRVYQLLNDPQKNTQRLSEKYNIPKGLIAILLRAAFEYRLAIKCNVMDILVNEMQNKKQSAA